MYFDEHNKFYSYICDDDDYYHCEYTDHLGNNHSCHIGQIDTNRSYTNISFRPKTKTTDTTLTQENDNAYILFNGVHFTTKRLIGVEMK